MIPAWTLLLAGLAGGLMGAAVTLTAVFLLDAFPPERTEG